MNSLQWLRSVQIALLLDSEGYLKESTWNSLMTYGKIKGYINEN